MTPRRRHSQLVMAVVLTGSLVVSLPAVGSLALGAITVDHNPGIMSQSQPAQEAKAESTDAWPMFGANAGNTGHINTTGPTGDITERWDFSTGDEVESSPAVVDGTVYVGSDDGNVYALDAATGTLQWTFETGGRVSSSPAVVDGTVYVGSNDKNVYAIDTKTGTEKWTFETDTEVSSSPTVVDDTVYVGSNGQLFGLDATTGGERWNFSTGNSYDVMSAPAVANGTVYINPVSGVYALNAETGSVKWTFEPELGRVDPGSPTVSAGIVYIVGNVEVYALDAMTGEVHWNHTTEFGMESSPAVVDDTLYVGSVSENLEKEPIGRVIALYTENGTERWTFELMRTFPVSSPAVVDGTVYFGNSADNLYAITTESGSVRWKFEMRDGIGGSPAVVDRTVYLGEGASNVVALAENSSTPISPSGNTPKESANTQTETEAVSQTIPGFGAMAGLVGIIVSLSVFARRRGGNPGTSE